MRMRTDFGFRDQRLKRSANIGTFAGGRLVRVGYPKPTAALRNPKRRRCRLIGAGRTAIVLNREASHLFVPLKFPTPNARPTSGATVVAIAATSFKNDQN